MTETLDVQIPDGRTIEVLTAGDPDGFPWLFHGGSPSAAAPYAYLDDVARSLGLRMVTYSRPGYGGSTPRPAPGRYADDVADSVGVLDALGIDEFITLGWSGGGPRALACAALLPDRCRAATSLAGVAPADGDGLDWFAGMAPSGVASLRAAAQGRAAKERYEATTTDAEPGFTDRDRAMFDGPWSWILEVVHPALAAGPAALVDDDLAYVAPWGFDPADVAVPLLIVHGGADLMVPGAHGVWLAEHCPTAELWLRPEDGHLSILNSAAAALEWLAQPRA